MGRGFRHGAAAFGCAGGEVHLMICRRLPSSFSVLTAVLSGPPAFASALAQRELRRRTNEVLQRIR